MQCIIIIKLLEKDEWRIFKGIAKRQKKIFILENQAKLRSFRLAPKYIYGFQAPRDYKPYNKI